MEPAESKGAVKFGWIKGVLVSVRRHGLRNNAKGMETIAGAVSNAHKIHITHLSYSK